MREDGVHASIKPMKWLTIILALSIYSTPAAAQERTTSTDSSQPSAAISPKSPWGDFPVVKEKEAKDPWYIQTLLWIPNRVMDFIDIFRLDLGVGPAYGGVVRITKYAQLGYRKMAPASVRIGDFGRLTPVMVERSEEGGAPWDFTNSREREICPGEIGLGLDLVVIGGYGGICLDEVADFIGGLFFYDFKHDDLK